MTTMQFFNDAPDSDLMCHETTIDSADQFNHKMLFASSDILSIDFTKLTIELVDQLLRDSRP